MTGTIVENAQAKPGRDREAEIMDEKMASIAVNAGAHAETSTDLNMVETGGAFGRKRRAPTFTIGRHENGTYFATDDTQGGRWKCGGFPTLDSITKALQPECDRRTSTY